MHEIFILKNMNREKIATNVTVILILQQISLQMYHLKKRKAKILNFDVTVYFFNYYLCLTKDNI